MAVAVYLALALAVTAGLAGRLSAGSLAPRAAATSLVVAGVVSALSWLWTLGLLSATLADDGSPAAGAVLGLHMNRDPVPAWLGLVAALCLCFCLVRCGRAAHLEYTSRRFLHQLAATCPAALGDLVVLDDPTPRAFALPRFLGSGGTIVISSGMLRTLDAPQRAVLLAHERSHLRHQHSWYAAIATFAAAALPALGGLRAQVNAVVERWADEDASAAAADRRAAAESIASAALGSRVCAARGRYTPPGNSGVPSRVAALLGASPRSSRSLLVGLGALLALLTVTTCEASRDLETLFDSGTRSAATAAGPTSGTYYRL